MTVGIEPEPRLAIRPGIVYTLDGKAKFTVPAGKYVLYSSRGFEYSVAETKLELKAGNVAKPRLNLSHEVHQMRYFLACDPHVHTLTHSGHGELHNRRADRDARRRRYHDAYRDRPQ